MQYVHDTSRQFVMVPFEVIEACPSAQALAVWVLLKKYANHRTKVCWPSRKTMAHQLGYKSPGSVDKAIKQLKEIGLIETSGFKFNEEDLSASSRPEVEGPKIGTRYIVHDLPAYRTPDFEPVDPDTMPDVPMDLVLVPTEETIQRQQRAQQPPATPPVEPVGKELEVIDAHPVEPPARKQTSTKRGTRLPEGWTPKPETVEKMVNDHPQITREWLQREHEIFTDYWIAQPGAKGTKLDWEATWRNWIRRSAQKLPARQYSNTPSIFGSNEPPSGLDARWEEARRIAAKIDAEGGLGSATYTG